jgi:hypothetical protein
MYFPLVVSSCLFCAFTYRAAPEGWNRIKERYKEVSATDSCGHYYLNYAHKSLFGRVPTDDFIENLSKRVRAYRSQ